MEGDDKVRFCSQCKLNVYNISEMSRTEAEDFLRKSEGRTCVRMFQRKDGTVLTRNCPVGLAAIRKRLAYAVAFAGAFAFGSFAVAMASIRPKDDSYRPTFVDQARGWPVVGRLIDVIDPPHYQIAGAIAMPMPYGPTAPRTKGP